MAASDRWTTIYAAAPREAAAGTGAGHALSALVLAHAPLLFRVASAVVRNPAEAEDILQNVFLRLLERPDLLSNVDDPRLWLIRVTFNRALDHRRRHRPSQLDPILAETLVARTLPADQLLETSEQIALVLREIDRLPCAERHALLLSAFDELTPNAIAAILGRTPSATRALLHRARTRLLQRLSQTARNHPQTPSSKPRN